MARKPRAYASRSRPPLNAGEGLRIGLYHRVSTLDQDPRLARDELAAWAQRKGHVVARIEESASGTWNERPGLQRLLDQARRGEIDCVAVWKLDRFGRSALDVLSNIRHLSNAGARFVAVTQGIDISSRGDPMSQLMLTVLSAVAEFERSLIVERTRLGMAKAKASGKHVGRPKLRHPAAERVVELKAGGMSWAGIAKTLKCSIGVARLRARELKTPTTPEAPQAQKGNR